jgi:hypothetical protein
MTVLIDMKSLQAAVHYGKYRDYASACELRRLEDKDRADALYAAQGERLETFLEIVRDCCRAKPQVSDGIVNELRLPLLSHYRILVILTRIAGCPFSPQELAQIEAYVAQGGNLLLMSNHDEHSEQDNVLAQRFGVHLEKPGFPSERERLIFGSATQWIHCRPFRLMHIGEKHRGKHFITDGLEGDLVFNTACRIRCTNPNARVLATLPGAANEADAYGIAIDKPEGTSSGRVVILGDSGFVGNDDSRFPGQGLSGHGANQQFVRNIMGWLLGQE